MHIQLSHINKQLGSSVTTPTSTVVCLGNIFPYEIDVEEEPGPSNMVPKAVLFLPLQQVQSNPPVLPFILPI